MKWIRYDTGCSRQTREARRLFLRRDDLIEREKESLLFARGNRHKRHWEGRGTEQHRFLLSIFPLFSQKINAVIY